MSLAWQNLERKGIVFNGSTSVYTTHLYIKFKPANAAQYQQLERDTNLALSDYPIESRIVQKGDYYHDASLHDSVPTYQYSAVKTNYTFDAGIAYELIEGLYIPEQDPEFAYLTGGKADLFVDQLLNQA